jgi:hypothetical protein
MIEVEGVMPIIRKDDRLFVNAIGCSETEAFANLEFIGLDDEDMKDVEMIKVRITEL